MSRTTLAAGTLLLAIILAGCGVKEKLSEVSIAADLANNGTLELMEKIENDEYDPPGDGRITPAQVDMYLKVREHEKKIAQLAHKQLEEKGVKLEEDKGRNSLAGMANAFSAMGTMADIATADLRAAHELGYNSAEYTWVKGQLLAAVSWDMNNRTTRAMSSMLDQGYAELKKQYEQATEPAMKQYLGEAIREYEQDRADTQADAASSDPEDAISEYNYKVIAKRTDPNTILAYEMVKWTGQSDEEMQKNVDEYTGQMEELDKAARSNE